MPTIPLTLLLLRRLLLLSLLPLKIFLTFVSGDGDDRGGGGGGGVVGDVFLWSGVKMSVKGDDEDEEGAGDEDGNGEDDKTISIPDWIVCKVVSSFNAIIIILAMNLLSSMSDASECEWWCRFVVIVVTFTSTNYRCW